MSMQNKSGFTIIEVVLFLSVSGLLMVGILAGASSSINQQRYRESVDSLATILRKQYSEVVNPSNDRTSDWNCDSSGGIVSSQGGESRGRTDCIIAGRLVYSSDGSRVVTANIVASKPGVDSLNNTDIDIFNNIDMKIDPNSIAVQELDWKGRLARSNGQGDAVFSVFIGRSLASGSVRTFITSNYPLSNPSDSNPAPSVDWIRIITTQALSNNLEVCVVSQSPMSGPTRQVQLLANSASSSGVRVVSEGVC